MMFAIASSMSASVLTWIMTENYWCNKVHFGKYQDSSKSSK